MTDSNISTITSVSGVKSFPPSDKAPGAGVTDIEKQDLADRDGASAAMRATWGDSEYDINLHLVNDLLDTLPPERRDWYESTGSNGKLRLNSPDILKDLADEARAKVPGELAAEMKSSGDTELQVLDRWMTDRNSPYWRNPKIQARYRTLLDQNARRDKDLPTTPAGIAEEIANIENKMHRTPRAYFRDETKQARYRELIAKRDD